MDWNRIEGNWKQLKGEARKQWGKLTDDDIEQVKGDRQKLAGKIQDTYGKSKEEAEREIDEWSTRQKL